MEHETAVNVEVEKLRLLVATQAQQIERFTKRVLAKDVEFQKERNCWKREKKHLKDTIRDLKRIKA